MMSANIASAKRKSGTRF